jgi:hypothetical protein
LSSKSTNKFQQQIPNNPIGINYLFFGQQRGECDSDSEGHLMNGRKQQRPQHFTAEQHQTNILIRAALN